MIKRRRKKMKIKSKKREKEKLRESDNELSNAVTKRFPLPFSCSISPWPAFLSTCWFIFCFKSLSRNLDFLLSCSTDLKSDDSEMDEIFFGETHGGCQVTSQESKETAVRIHESGQETASFRQIEG